MGGALMESVACLLVRQQDAAPGRQSEAAALLAGDAPGAIEGEHGAGGGISVGLGALCLESVNGARLSAFPAPPHRAFRTCDVNYPLPLSIQENDSDAPRTQSPSRRHGVAERARSRALPGHKAGLHG